VGLIGPNGAGKTTVFNCLSSFYRPNEGQLLWEGKDITYQPPQYKLREGIARTFQNLELFKNLTVMENLLIGQHPRLKQSLWSSMLLTPATRLEEKVARQRAREILAFLEISDTENMRPGSLPFGKQKRVELARALVSRPRLILLDEPAAGANNRETADLAKLIRRIRDEFGIAVLLVEHDMSFVMNLCERLYVLDFGKKIAEGTPDKVQADPAVIEAYLGEREELVDSEEERNNNEATTKSAPERT
jgi:branched-chain amino acid transport system ATP-binding protein